MGNFINPPQGSSSFLLNPIHPGFELLIKWKKYAILNFHNTYLKLFPLSIHLTLSEFSKLVNSTLIAFDSEYIFSKFKYLPTNTANILEFLATVIIFSSSDLEDKIEMAFKIFDFDHSEDMNPDEFHIMLRCFFRGIRIASESNSEESQIEEAVYSQIFNSIDLKSEKIIRFPELLKWVKNNKVLNKLCSRTEHFNTRSSQNRLSLPEAIQKFSKKRRSSISTNPQLPSLSYINPSLKEYKDLFLSCCNRQKKCQVSTLYNKMIKIKMFQKYANEFYTAYHFKLKTEMGLLDFLKFFKNYAETPYERSNKFVKQRRQGFSMKNPKGELKQIIDEKDFKERTQKKMLLSLFKKYDENRDGFIDLRELKNGLKEFVTVQGIEGLFKEHDEDKNNLLDFEEFLVLCKPLNETFTSRRVSRSM